MTIKREVIILDEAWFDGVAALAESDVTPGQIIKDLNLAGVLTAEEIDDLYEDYYANYEVLAEGKGMSAGEVKDAVNKLLKNKSVMSAIKDFKSKKIKKGELYKQIFKIASKNLAAYGIAGVFLLGKVIWALIKGVGGHMKNVATAGGGPSVTIVTKSGVQTAKGAKAVADMNKSHAAYIKKKYGKGRQAAGVEEEPATMTEGVRPKKTPDTTASIMESFRSRPERWDRA